MQMGWDFHSRLADVEQLLDTLPLSGNLWSTTYNPIMGGALNQNLIWGSYDDGLDNDPLIGDAYAYSDTTI